MPAIRTTVRNVILLILSLGWLAPLTLAGMTFLTWARAVDELTVGRLPSLSSFPFVRFMEQTGMIALLWLAAAVLYWTIAGLRARKRA